MIMIGLWEGSKTGFRRPENVCNGNFVVTVESHCVVVQLVEMANFIDDTKQANKTTEFGSIEGQKSMMSICRASPRSQKQTYVSPKYPSMAALGKLSIMSSIAPGDQGIIFQSILYIFPFCQQGRRRTDEVLKKFCFKMSSLMMKLSGFLHSVTQTIQSNEHSGVLTIQFK